MALQSDLDNALREDRSRCINELCTLIQSLQQLLFASSTTAQPILTPRTLMKELDEMEKVNARLSAVVEEVTLEHCKKNEIVKHRSQEMALQRQEAANDKAPQSERGIKSRAILGRQVKGIVTEQIIEVESGLGPYEIEYDEEWLAITRRKVHGGQQSMVDEIE
ncbi:hypothetical protein Lser_V15G42843 [Lactuca serriola]